LKARKDDEERFAPPPQPTPEELFYGTIANMADPSPAAGAAAPYVRLANERELAQFVEETWGVRIPDRRVCKGHRAPLEALAAAYFAEHPRIVWKASRTFGGKTVLLAALSLTEARCLGASVTLLGGSFLQSRRAHDYMQGMGGMAGRFWRWRKAPISLLTSDPTQRATYLANGGLIEVLPASAKATRGGHPQRLRGDELDEMDQTIWDGAVQSAHPDGPRGIMDQIVGSSTFHKPNGTMASELRTARDRGWPVFEWCFRETMAARGFITEQMVARKRASITVRDFNVEFELQEPNPEGLAIDSEAVEAAFQAGLGEHAGEMGTRVLFEKPLAGATYATGVDWGKELHHTVIWTNRTDVTPVRLVAFASVGRMPYPVMEEMLEKRLRRYPGPCSYDHTGVGVGVGDHLEVPADTEAFDMVGRARTRLFQEWIAALERGEFAGPLIESAYQAHRTVTFDDLYGSGHPPDEFIAAALAWRAGSAAPFLTR
jgi:hypothetical protein